MGYSSAYKIDTNDMGHMPGPWALSVLPAAVTEGTNIRKFQQEMTASALEKRQERIAG
jgi:hypothetical protein